MDRGGLVWEACPTPVHIAWPCATIYVGVATRPPRLFAVIASLTCSLWHVHWEHHMSLVVVAQTYMGDSREVPHVNIVRKLRHSCEDVIFASSIYSNTLKHFNFIVDYCLSLHIMYKHSQTRTEHFLYKPLTNDVHSKFTQVRNLHLFYEDTYDLLKRNIGDISRDLNNCWIVEENSFPSMYHKGLNMSRFFCNRLFDDVIYAQSNVRKTLFLNVTFCIACKREPWARVCYWTVSQLLLNVWLIIFISCAGTFWYRIHSLTILSDLETKSILFCSLAKQYVWWCPQCCGYELWHAP